MMTETMVHAAGSTHIGRVRSTNQDSFLCASSQGLFIVADGMGGHAGGEIASRVCIETMMQHVQSNELFRSTKVQHPDSKIHVELGRAINAASAKVYERALEEPSLKGMGTTATGFVLMNNYIYYAHVGDSRLYLVRSGFIYQITFDHSLVSEQVRAGILTKEEAELHHLRNVITRSVGYQEEEDVDSGVVQTLPGDIFMLCSDGLYGKVQDREISQILQRLKDKAGDELIALANERGGEDNISVVIVAV